MAEIKKEMNVLEVMSIFPKASTILTQNNIKSLKVFESLEKNILAAGKDVEEIVDKINKEFEESKKPVKIDADKLVDISEEAAEELKKLMVGKNKKGWSVRLLIHSPSPNKYSYAMDFEKNPAKDDVVVKKHGLRIFVSKSHAQSIEKGLRIEFYKKEHGFKFVKENV